MEARLIQAEAALQANDPTTFMSILNTLRSGVNGLSQLTDPGTDSARVVLLFAERAAWLFMTGARQGDLRRLLRQYHQFYPQRTQAYPSGPYLTGTGQSYGTEVTVPIPMAEDVNPLFHGCLNRAP